MCTLKVPYPSVVNSVGLTAGDVKTRKHCTQGEREKKLGSAVPFYGCSLSPGGWGGVGGGGGGNGWWGVGGVWGGGKQPEFPVHCTGIQKKKLSKSNVPGSDSHGLVVFTDGDDVPSLADV